MDLRPVLLLAVLIAMLAWAVACVFGADCRCCGETAASCQIEEPGA